MKLSDEVIGKIANEYFIKAWNECSDEWSPRGAFKAGFQACRDSELATNEFHHKTAYEFAMNEIDSLKAQNENLIKNTQSLLNVVNLITAPWRHHNVVAKGEELTELSNRQIEVESRLKELRGEK